MATLTTSPAAVQSTPTAPAIPDVLTIKGHRYSLSPIPIPPEFGSVAFRVTRLPMFLAPIAEATDQPSYVVHRDRSGRVVCECGDYIWRCQDAGPACLCKHGRSLIEAGLIAAPGRAGFVPQNAEEAEGWREYAVWSASLPADTAAQGGGASAASEASTTDTADPDVRPMPSEAPGFAEELREAVERSGETIIVIPADDSDAPAEVDDTDPIGGADRRWAAEHPVNPAEYHFDSEAEADADFMRGFEEVDPREMARINEERYFLPSREEPWW